VLRCEEETTGVKNCFLFFYIGVCRERLRGALGQVIGGRGYGDSPTMGRAKKNTFRPCIYIGGLTKGVFGGKVRGGGGKKWASDKNLMLEFFTLKKEGWEPKREF